MVSLIAFILTIVGSLNWFFIGILQYDFVAGLFGSQANLFSRIIYFLVGVASIVVLVNFITNKGKFVISFNKAKDEMSEMKTTRRQSSTTRRKTPVMAESAKDYHIDRKSTTPYNTYHKDDSEDDKVDTENKDDNK